MNVARRQPTDSSPVTPRVFALCGLLSLVACVTLAQQDIDTARDLYNRALAAAERGNNAEAADSWSSALKLFLILPGTERQQADCRKNLGTVLRHLGRGGESMAQMRQAVQLYQTLQGTAFQQARCCQSIGWTLDSLSQYKEAMAQTQQALQLYQTLQGAERDQAACHGTLGSLLRNLGKSEEALAHHQQALKLFQALPATEGAQADCHNNLGGALSNLGKHEEALTHMKRALALYQTVQGSERDQARCCQNIGEVLRNLCRYDEALAQHNKALQILQSLPDTERQQADCYGNLGATLCSLGKFEDAIVQIRQALKLYGAFQGADRDQADCCQNLGVALSSLGKHEQAIAQTQQALRLYLTLEGTALEQARCSQNLGVTLAQLERHEEALVCHRQALTLFQSLQGTAREQADCYNNLGTSLRDLGKYEEAMAQMLLALRHYQPLRNTERPQAGCYGNLGTMLRDLGKYEEALGPLQLSLALFQSLHAAERELAGCHQNLGGVLFSLGKFEEALAQTQQALKLYQALAGTEREQARCRLNLGGALDSLDRQQEAMAQHQQALRLFQSLQGTERDQLACWGNIGRSHLGAGRLAEAIAAFKQSGQTAGIAVGLSQAYRRRGEPGDQARALSVLLRAGERAESARVELLAREHREGIFEQVAGVFPELTSLLAEWGGTPVGSEDAAVVRWARDPRSASAGLEAAFHFADQGKGRALNDALRERSSLKAARADARLLAEDKDLSQQLSSRMALRERLPEAQAERRDKLTRDIEELQQRRNMGEVELKRTALGGYVAPAFRRPLETAADLSPDTAVLQYSVGERDVWLLLLTREGVTAHRLACETRALPEARVHQQTAIGHLVDAWQKRPEKIGLDGLVQLALARAEDQGREVKRSLVDAAQEQAVLQRLGNTVLPASALAEVRQKSIHHLLVIPDGSLHYVPFAMLRIAAEGGAASRYVLEEFSVSYTPAMTTLEALREQKKAREQLRKRERRQLLAFANPSYSADSLPLLPAKGAGDDMITRAFSVRRDYYAGSGLRLRPLPETEQEALRVASLFGPPQLVSGAAAVDPDASALVLTSMAASEEQAKRLLGTQSGLPGTRWRYLLFSTHGLSDPQNGMLSFVALSAPTADSSEDGFLQAQEVLDLELDTDLVMLSACQTGLGRLRGGEGLVGLSGAFFVAGAESVSASLWDVPSGPTGQLVTEYFKRLKEGKTDRAEALRQAQLTVMCNGKTADGKAADYASPFCWAAFVLIGE